MTVQARLAQRSRDARARAGAAAAWEGVNDARQGRVRVVAAPVAPPASAPRRGEFVRAAVAVRLGGIFPRGDNGCPPYVP
jgi:hypothetical protein